jgi:hypothetical protein
MDEDIYYIDTRNATPVVIGRSSNGQPVVAGTHVIRPGSMGGSIGGRQIMGQPGFAYGGGRYVQAPLGGTLGASLFGGMTGGQLVDLVAQIFAAVMPLPNGPVSSGDVGTDVSNLVLYQTSLAQYAKRDEQIRTLGSLVTKLLG